MTEIKLKTKLSAYAKGVIPTKVSQLEQDIDYTTEAPKDDKIYARKNGEWENISTEQDNKAYVRENDNWVELDEKLEEKKYIDERELRDYDTNLKEYISDNYIDNQELDSYDLATKEYISDNYIDNTELNTYDTNIKRYIEDKDYVSDIPTANNKVYARKKGEWEELDIENMGAINIDTPIESGLTSREIPKEESHEARNKYVIEMNKWEGNLENVPQQLEDGKFYYAVDPVEIDTLLDGGNSQTNQFQQQVDILTTRFQLRTDTALNWRTYNPILEYGEPGWEIDTHKLKIGDGLRTWNNLGYQSGENLNKEVLTNLGITSNGDNLTLDREYTNLQTDLKTYSSIEIPLADSDNAGLMATADYIALQDVISRVEDLEGKTTRLLYLNTPITQDIEIIIDSVLETGSVLKEGSVVNGVEIVTDTTLLVDTDLYVGDLIKTGSTVANSSLINNATYPNENTINSFVVGEGYTSPFEGIAVVVNGTYHIWHYYENDNIGWKDDGLDTVSNFTNQTAGVILGSNQAGKVFAENDGTGSVVGWDNLTNRVGTNESAISGLQTNVTNIQNAKVTQITSQSTDATYPSSKAVYDFVSTYTPPIQSLTDEEIDEMWEDTPELEPMTEIGTSNYNIPLNTFTSSQDLSDYLQGHSDIIYYEQGVNQSIYGYNREFVNNVIENDFTLFDFDLAEDAEYYYEYYAPMVGQSLGTSEENGVTYDWVINYVAMYNNFFIVETLGIVQNNGEVLEIQSNNYQTIEDVDGGTIYSITTEEIDKE